LTNVWTSMASIETPGSGTALALEDEPAHQGFQRLA